MLIMIGKQGVLDARPLFYEGRGPPGPAGD